jgi:hypothetical protein
MALDQPFDQIVGPVTVYVGPASEPVPDVDTVPAGNWLELGALDGDVAMEWTQSVVYFSDNDHTGDIKAARESESLMVTLPLVGVTHINLATILSDAANIAVDAGPPAISTVPFKRGVTMVFYAILLVGAADSPFGNFPAFRYVPKGVFDGSPVETRSQAGRPVLEVVLHALEDITQAAGDELGWTSAQTA